MMKVLACLVVFLTVSPLAPAEEPAAPRNDSPKGASAPEDSRRYVTGTLRDLDPEAATVTFLDEAGKERTWPVDERIAQSARGAAERRLHMFKPGDAIRVTYQLDASGEPKVIDIGRSRPAQGKEGEERRPATPPASPAPPQ